MAHKTLIGGTSYTITGGKSLISGTVYSISKGRTLIGGTGYDIQFTPPQYAMLYSDGNMVFQMDNTVNNNKTLINDYTISINKQYSNYRTIPWYYDVNKITNVSFRDEMSPESMAHWFYNAQNIKIINYDNLYTNSIIYMQNSHAQCNNLTSSPICGDNVVNMYNAYVNCHNLTGSPVCGNNVVNMYQTYYNCKNLTGSPACGNNVKQMYCSYYNCQNLTGSPACGDNVVDMTSAYVNCQNLTGSPACGNNVVNMYQTYYNCRNLTGSPVCGNNVVDMEIAYYSCRNLTGSPVCGENVVDMGGTYSYCYNLTGSPVCGDNVVNMYGSLYSGTYQNCTNLTGSPVCGEKVENMTNAYYGCTNLTGSPVCGEKVTSISYAYCFCYNLTGSPVCGNNVTNMYNAYGYCNNLTGSPVCGDNVTDMLGAYTKCTNLTGSPVCGEKVFNFQIAYRECHNLTGSPVCGNNVISMTQSYYDCHNLTGSPVCGENVTNMYQTYYNCINLTGSPVCGEKVTNMYQTYSNCQNLTGSPVCGENVVDMSYAYSNCQNLTGSMYCHNKNMTTFRSCFAYKNNSSIINIYVPPNSTTNKSVAITNTYSVVGKEITWTTDANNKCYYNTAYNIYIYPILGFEIENSSNVYLPYSSTKSISIKYTYDMDDEIPKFTITSDDTSVVNISDIIVENKTINFNITSNNLEGNAIITIVGEITSSEGVNFTDLSTFKIVVNETGEAPLVGYEVESIDGASYGFELNDNGYYESQNVGIDGSYSICKIALICDGTSNLYLDCINSGESNYDYGILSNVDKTLSLSNSADSVYYKSFKGLSSSSIQTVDYGVLEVGEHFIYVKFRKDGSVNDGNDSLQFKVRFE